MVTTIISLAYLVWAFALSEIRQSVRVGENGSESESESDGDYGFLKGYHFLKGPCVS